MECPFELLVEKEISTQDAGKTYYRIIDANNRSIAAGLTEKNADYIVQVINSYEKLDEAIDEIEAVSCGEKQIESDGVYDDSDGMSWIYKRIQTLKKAEKP